MIISGRKYDLNLQLFAEDDDVLDVPPAEDDKKVEKKGAEATPEIVDPNDAPVDDILDEPEPEKKEPAEKDKEVEKAPPADDAPVEYDIDGKKYSADELKEALDVKTNQHKFAAANTQRAEMLAKQARDYQAAKKPEVEKFEYKPSKTNDEELDNALNAQGEQFADMHNSLLERTAKQDEMIGQLVGKVQMGEDTQVLTTHKVEVEEQLGRKLTNEEWDNVQAITLGEVKDKSPFSAVAQSLYGDKTQTIEEVNATLAKNRKLKAQGSKGQKGGASNIKLSDLAEAEYQKQKRRGWDVSREDFEGM